MKLLIEYNHRPRLAKAELQLGFRSRSAELVQGIAEQLFELNSSLSSSFQICPEQH